MKRIQESFNRRVFNATKIWQIQWIVAIMVQLALIPCAMGGDMVQQSFSFDTLHDSPDAEVLDYQYGSTRQMGIAAEKGYVEKGRVFRRWNTSGVYPRGEFLYVKWRLKSSGQIYEDKVDLRSRLPADITNHRIHFVINGQQLYIYLISPEKRPAGEPPGPLRLYSGLKQYQIYPAPTP